MAIRPFTVLAVVVVVVVKRMILIAIYANHHVERVFVARNGDCEYFLICAFIFRDDQLIESLFVVGFGFSCGDTPLHCAGGGGGSGQTNNTYANTCQPACGQGLCCSRWGL